MMARNPNWWGMHPPSLFPQYAPGSPSLPVNPLGDDQEPPQSWRQLLLGGLSAGDEDKIVLGHFQPRKLDNWEDQILNPPARLPVVDVVKQEVPQNSNLYGHGGEDFQAPRPAWSQMIPVSSPSSCVTSFSNNNNKLDFSYNKVDGGSQHPNQSSESTTTATGGACKKARLQSSSTQQPLKVRKEKLGDRITALHQLVSPFGKTDTASVLLEAIAYIKFLLSQIEALSSPYLGNASKNMRNQQCLLNDTCLKRRGAPNQDTQDKPKDLTSRGLCLVPLSCTQHVGSDNGADYWTPAYDGAGF